MKPEGSQPFCAGAVKPKKVLKIQSYAHKNYSISIQYLPVNEALYVYSMILKRKHTVTL
jgi:hypothetical protein